MNFPSNASLKQKCVFWRPEESETWNTSGCEFVPWESNASVTTCECDHLTIFAAIMDPYDLPVAQNHKESLEIISVAGCTISLLAVLITIVVTLSFWRVLKSPRAHVLLNLCAAIAATCALSILERAARNMAGCPVVAASLHYFLLALFSWMLCEGVLHYYLLIKVFGVGVGNKVKYFYMFGWGFPAIVVTISLAVTKAHGYGSKDICWLDVNSGLIWAFIAPALLVIVINTGIFVLVIYQMMRTKYMQDKTHIGRVKAGVKASAVILPLLGITWLFGLLSFNSNTITFKYIFAIFNSLQGLVIFIFHCVLNKQIKDAIKRKRDKTSTGMMSSIRRSKLFSSLKWQQQAEESTSTPNKQPNGAQGGYKMTENVTSEQDNSTDQSNRSSPTGSNCTLDSVDTKCSSMVNNSSIDTQKQS